MEKEKKKRRNRRTNLEVEKDIMEAVKAIIEEVGFANTTLTAVAQKAKVEPQVIYNRFNDLSGLFDKFVQRYDYWFSDIIDSNVEELNSSNSEAFLEQMLDNMIESLYKNKSMQEILIWEIAENNRTTVRYAKMREINAEHFIRYYGDLFKGTNININVIVSLLIGGAYYLILRKDRSTFCNIDFNTKSGKEQLIESINTFCSWMFSSINNPNHLDALQIARNMKNDGMDSANIAKYTELSIDVINSL